MAGLLVVVGGVIWFAARAVFESERSYYVDMLRLHRESERAIRQDIASLLRTHPRQDPDPVLVASIFQKVRLGDSGGSSREVRRWADAPHSPERTAVALRWARLAADEATFQSAIYTRWVEDFNQGRWPHHISDDEVKPIKMPEWWSEDDVER